MKPMWVQLGESRYMDECGYVFRCTPDAIIVTSPKAAEKPLDENWMRVAPGTDAAIWRPWSRETGEL